MTELNRRQVLKGAGLATLGLLLSQGASWATAPSAAAMPVTLHPLLGTPLPLQVDPAPTGPGGSYLPPFTATASATLSEDYFLTSEVILGAGDLVRPFQRPDGTVEALVLSADAICYLGRDATSSSGWSYSQIPVPADLQSALGPAQDCAVGLGSDGTVYAVVSAQDFSDDGGLLLMMWASLAPGSQTWSVLDDIPETIFTPIGPLGSGVDPTGAVYMYAVNNDGTILLWQPQAGLGAESAVINGLPTGTYTSARLLWNPGYDSSTDPVAQQGGVIVTTGQAASLWSQVDGSSVTHNADFVAFGLVLWMGWPVSIDNQDVQGPAYAAQDTAGNVLYSDGISGQFSVSQLSAVAGGAAVWSQNEMSSYALLIGDTLNVVTQYDNDPQTIQFTDPIPIADALTSVAGCAADPQQGTLFVVDDAGTLHVLSKDPTIGVWTDTPVHQATASTVEIDCWRAQLSLADSNGTPLSNCQVSITPDRAVGIWQPSGSFTMDPTHPLTTTSDSMGRVTFGIPATELDTAILSVQVLQDGTPSGPPITVNPSQNVHDFLAGTGSIDGVGTITNTDGSALINAKDGNGNPIFPTLANISDPTQQTQAAAGVAASINQCMAAGQGVTPGQGDTQSFTLDFSSGTPTYTPSTSPAPDLIGSSGWWDSVKNDAESVFHGIRHGLITVAKCAASWAADAKQWTVSLAITIGEDVADAVVYAITDIKSAIHAISGFFSRLGADIKAAITWLRTNIKETFAAAETNTQTLLGWLDNLGGSLTNDLTALTSLVDGYFIGLENRIDTEIDTVIAPALTGMTIAQFTDSSVGTPAGGVSDVADDLVKILQAVSGNWLLDKILSVFDSGSQTAGASDPVTTALNDLIAAVTGTSWFGDLGSQIWQTFSVDSTADAKNVKDLAFTAILSLIRDLADDALKFADGVIDKVIALLQAMIDEWVDLLETTINEVPLIGAILAWFGVDLTTSVGHLFGLILMFPTTIAYKVFTGGDGVMFQTQTGTAVAAVADPLGQDLQFSHAAIRGIGALIDSAVDVGVLVDSETPNEQRVTPLKWVGYLDTLFTAAICTVTYPGPKNPDGTTIIPFSKPVLPSNPTSQDWKVYFKYIIGWLNPTLTGAAQACKAFELAAGYTTYFPIVRFAIGASVLGLGVDILANKANQTGETYGYTVLETLPVMLSPLALAAINDDTLAIPLAVKLLIDLAGELTAATLIARVAQGE